MPQAKVLWYDATRSGSFTPRLKRKTSMAEAKGLSGKQGTSLLAGIGKLCKAVRSGSSHIQCSSKLCVSVYHITNCSQASRILRLQRLNCLLLHIWNYYTTRTWMHFLQFAAIRDNTSDLAKEIESLRVTFELLDQKRTSGHAKQYEGAQDKGVCTDKELPKADCNDKGIQTDSVLPQVYWIHQLFVLRNSGNSGSGCL